MKPKLNKDFEVFQREFKKWQEKFGLNGYQVYFKHEKIGDCFGDIHVNHQRCVATVRLDTQRGFGYNVKKTAKHEALHLLTNRLQDCALNRYVSEEDIIAATEELVVKLQGLIE